MDEVRAEVREGLDRVQKLPTGTGYADITAGVKGNWKGGVNPFVRGEVGYKLKDRLSAFGYGEADIAGYQAGVGLRVDW